eukprot:CAMPEP_0181220584 /NCGR_PEP_ID=MMETSP1096-20121128/28919_1 /TAXON_ID=156174 ORGANISM="Chrysochromulina ericina, Strain CCMP281" /NCGR_SAMPLE_ID=MMETSP1096 /ASSEMBLY_ACC=CAM_ASM_000453 /LENGTH=105 /DNA_ID=CAMNT_0023313105 /DNA_START=366 /DNA_END=684 /DNA_ORIENTATION=+
MRATGGRSVGEARTMLDLPGSSRGPAMAFNSPAGDVPVKPPAAFRSAGTARIEAAYAEVCAAIAAFHHELLRGSAPNGDRLVHHERAVAKFRMEAGANEQLLQVG